MAELKVGDKVMWKGSWGQERPQLAKVIHIDLCSAKREKYGVSVKSAPWSMKDYLTVSLDNGHWAYGEQLEAVC